MSSLLVKLTQIGQTADLFDMSVRIGTSQPAQESERVLIGLLGLAEVALLESNVPLAFADLRGPETRESWEVIPGFRVSTRCTMKVICPAAGVGPRENLRDVRHCGHPPALRIAKGRRYTDESTRG